jgi:hypothetical protein
MPPLKPVINVKCPCCHEILEIDVEHERVLAHRKGRHLRDDAAEGEDGLDVAVRQHKETTSTLDDRFRSAQKNLAGQSDRLEAFFKEATDKAKKAKPGDDPPKKLWD